jgi:L,D-transpeptidase ErfK/SrfK
MITLLFALIFTQKLVVVDLENMRWIAIENGVIVKSGEAIGGAERCPSDRRRNCRTPIGTFKILAKHGHGYRSGKYPVDCQNRWTCGARMYYFMPFHKDGIGLHGSDMMTGRHESHGCIRLHPKDAQWLNRNFVETGTEVIILPY